MQNINAWKTAWYVALFCLFLIMPGAGAGQDAGTQEDSAAENDAVGKEIVVTPLPGMEQPDSARINLDFKDADIRNVLKILAYKSGINIIASPEVVGLVNIELRGVSWEDALKTILNVYGYGYDQRDNIITVAPIDRLTTQKKQEFELAQIQPTQMVVFNLKFIDAQDAKRALEPVLSERGRLTILEMTGQSGWEFSSLKKGESLAKERRIEKEVTGRSKILIVSDVPPVIDKIKKVIEQIDVMPRQVLIESRIMEVNRDKLKDIGFDWGSGSGGAESSTISITPIDKKAGVTASGIGGHSLGSQVKPSGFSPSSGTSSTSVSSTEPYNIGMEVLFQKLSGTQFEVMLHALEEDVDTNTLSAPRIVALNNQEATILVGTKYPILKTDTTGAGSTAVTNITLDYYQDIGIQLNVVPQVDANGYINMVVHPAVNSYTDTLGTNAYPIIQTREAETRILMKDGETIVIGGLLKDAKTKTIIGTPFLSKIPILGIFFQRQTTDIQKIDLLVFITAHIVKEGGISEDEVKRLEEGLGKEKHKHTNKKKRK